ncbi:Fic family protein [Xanthomonas arboricola]|uniref:Fic family protein n=1 Tax=Xanthomonas arboricola TaxID=56448 RepID=UPI002B2C9026|nr:Fic family protein [Xanthomonas arboricola]
MLVSQFVPPNKVDVNLRLGKRLAGLELARSDLVDRRYVSQANEALRKEAAYWLALNRDLLHPLSEKWLQGHANENGRAFRDPADEQDLAAYAKKMLRGRKALTSDELIDWLCEVNGLTKIAGSGKIRKVNVFTSIDKSGRQTAFSKPGDLHRQFGLLSQAINDWEERPAFRALLVLVGVLAIHPFVDGNGRTARACFNAMLFDEPPITFIPLRLVSDCSCGGFEIRLRDVIFNGSWGSLIAYFSIVFELC